MIGAAHADWVKNWPIGFNQSKSLSTVGLLCVSFSGLCVKKNKS